MGWITTSDFVPGGTLTVRGYLDRNFSRGTPDASFEVIDSAMHNMTEYYAAIRVTAHATSKSYVTALIAKVSYTPRDPSGQTLGWKTMSEGMLPYLFNCPERILELLEPPACPNAIEWRQKCRDTRAKKCEAKRVARIALQHGTVVLFKEPLVFPHDVERQRFTVEKQGRKLRFRAEDGVLCAIPKAATMAFETVEAAA